ncbi:TniB family NTP-binding protein [Endozoicomonas sp. YOMI1]|uniref:TniB family NTP-binding protein n=1 Tax=Endozoicomonas sp. YOMI1 TaxID=2828739 RepID=UPI0021487E44|nr:TniB family NTP-binding protein [Endozoicomonas sp. YOMI1]
MMRQELTEQQKAKIKEIRNTRVWMDFHLSVIDEMYDCKDLSKLDGEPICMAIYGDTGAGKSEMMEMFKNDHKRYEKVNSTVIPVVYTVLPPKVSGNGLLRKIIKSMGLGIEDYKDFEFDDLMEIIVEMVDKLGVELFIIDEAQGLLEHDTRKHLYEATECIKALIIATKRPVILFGLPWCITAIEYNPQLASRFLRRRFLAPFKISDEKSRAEYFAFLDALDDAFGFEKKAGLGESKIALRLFAASRGNLRVLRGIIDQAATYAISENASMITYDHLKKACSVCCPACNAFNIESLKDVEFVELAKPSYWDKNARRGQNPVVEQTFTPGQKLSEALSAC